MSVPTVVVLPLPPDVNGLHLVKGAEVATVIVASHLSPLRGLQTVANIIDAYHKRKGTG